MPRLVQFMHPGGQPDHKGPGIKPWNTGKHRRSFLVAPGVINASSSASSEDVPRPVFWGEWDAPAEGILLAAGDAAHTAFAPCSADFPWQPQLQNTDPFVFDGPFLYSNCKQVRKDGVATGLRDLDRGDVVLFGAKTREGFVLDTVFVVADSTLYRTRTGPEQLAEQVPHSFLEVTLKPLAYPDGGTHSDRPPQNCSNAEWTGEDERSSCQRRANAPEVENRLYWGATPDTRVNDMFSFVPAKRASEPLAAFHRPVVKDFVSPNMSMGFRVCLDGSEHAIKDAWS